MGLGALGSKRKMEQPLSVFIPLSHEAPLVPAAHTQMRALCILSEQQSPTAGVPPTPAGRGPSPDPGDAGGGCSVGMLQINMA